jgi:hypothetical protein
MSAESKKSPKQGGGARLGLSEGRVVERMTSAPSKLSTQRHRILRQPRVKVTGAGTATSRQLAERLAAVQTRDKSDRVIE